MKLTLSFLQKYVVGQEARIDALAKEVADIRKLIDGQKPSTNTTMVPCNDISKDNWCGKTGKVCSGIACNIVTRHQ
jgi:hypothetical protein